MNKKAAIGPSLLKILNDPAVGSTLARAGAGGLGGGLIGRYVTPPAFGYDDVPDAKNVSTTLNALTGAILAGLGGTRISTMVGKNPALALGIPSAIVGEELIPQAIATMSKNRESMEEQTRNTIPAAISRIAGGGVGRGALAGTAAAGLAGLGTGLTRARTEEELKSRKSRARMIASDFMKYVLPLAIAGGVTGGVAENMNNKQASAKPRTARQDDIQRLLKHI